MSKGRNYIGFESTTFHLDVNKPINTINEQSERVVTLYSLLLLYL